VVAESHSLIACIVLYICVRYFGIVLVYWMLRNVQINKSRTDRLLSITGSRVIISPSQI